MEEALSNYINLSHYSHVENEDTFEWHINPQIFEGNFCVFLQEQYTLYDLKDVHENFILNLRKLSSGQERLNLAKTNPEHFYKLCDYIYEVMSFNNDRGFRDRVECQFELLTFLQTEKL